MKEGDIMAIDWEGVFGDEAYDVCGDDIVNMASYDPYYDPDTFYDNLEDYDD
jgi:hypothetical protein